MQKPFPTVFAKVIAINCELYIPDDERGINVADYLEKVERLIVFQQISVASDFEVALQAYYEYELSEYQKEQLMLIYSTTRAWLLGYLSGHLIESLESKLTSGRDKKEIVQTFLEAFVKPPPNTENEAKKGLLIEFAKNNQSMQVPKILTPQNDAGE